jgi:hypothetical protein
MKRAFRLNWAVRDAETGEQISGLFSFKRDAEKRLTQLDFMGRPLEVYRVTLKPSVRLFRAFASSSARKD